ncbi:MAG: tetratricopeptide repeat protein [Desulfovibrionaceae bacterium]|nr:tetratricopeptide repeat protein [Desulfovibrionaceae bacterium]
MESKTKAGGFQVAVIDREQSKLGMGGTSKTAERLVYYYAEQAEDGALYVQALNGNFVPAGEKTPVEPEKFVERYKPEPLVYFNKVKPAMDELQHNLDKGEAHLKNNNPDKAEASFKKALAVNSENVKAIFGLGIAYLNGGKLEDAGGVFNDIMALNLAFDEEHTHLFNEFGIKMRKAGMLDKAAEYYNKAIKLNENDDHLHFNVARIFFELKNCEKARESLVKALEINPGFTEAGKLLKIVDKMSGEDVKEDKSATD